MPTPPFPGGHRPFPVDNAEVGQGAPAECGKIPNLQEFGAELPSDYRERDLQQAMGVLQDREPFIFEPNDGIPAVVYRHLRFLKKSVCIPQWQFPVKYWLDWENTGMLGCCCKAKSGSPRLFSVISMPVEAPSPVSSRGEI